jgi:hypothetical protein
MTATPVEIDSPRDLFPSTCCDDEFASTKFGPRPHRSLRHKCVDITTFGACKNANEIAGTQSCGTLLQYEQ